MISKREVKTPLRNIKSIWGMSIISLCCMFPLNNSIAQSNDELNFNPQWIGDWGDAPDPSYPTLPASDGASHQNSTNIWLGAGVSLEYGPEDSDDPDGIENLSPSNMDGFDDGVEFLGSGPGSGQQGPPWSLPYVPGEPGAVRVYVSGSQAENGYVHGWIDWNHDGDWDDTGEQIFSGSQAYQPGQWSTIVFNVPESLTPGDLWARMRVDLQNHALYSGTVGDGEVEDYLIEGGIVPVELNSFDAKDLGGIIKLRWQTRSETENLGFYILRAEIMNGAYCRVNKDLIPGSGTTIIGKAYEYFDQGVESGETYYYKLISESFSGHIEEYGPIKVSLSAHPELFILEQNYPNPFNPKTAIGLHISEYGHVSLKVYDIEGREVRTLVNEALPAGHYQAVWDGCDNSQKKLPNGTYIYKMEYNGSKKIKRMTMVK